jgi:hypothetical protein
VDVRVDEPWHHDEITGVDDACIRARGVVVLADADDAAAFDVDRRRSCTPGRENTLAANDE